MSFVEREILNIQVRDFACYVNETGNISVRQRDALVIDDRVLANHGENLVNNVLLKFIEKLLLQHEL